MSTHSLRVNAFEPRVLLNAAGFAPPAAVPGMGGPGFPAIERPMLTDGHPDFAAPGGRLGGPGSFGAPRLGEGFRPAPEIEVIYIVDEEVPAGRPLDLRPTNPIPAGPVLSPVRDNTPPLPGGVSLNLPSTPALLGTARQTVGSLTGVLAGIVPGQAPVPQLDRLAPQTTSPAATTRATLAFLARAGDERIPGPDATELPLAAPHGVTARTPELTIPLPAGQPTEERQAPPAPQEAGALPFLQPPELSSVVAEVRQFLNQVEHVGQATAEARPPIGMTPWIVAAVTAGAACLIARRQLRTANAAVAEAPHVPAGSPPDEPQL